ncbi:MAG: UDP-N-acetylmuramoyl-L-alanine--D-glutamate ligase [Patescibacteria group bacterium]|nr:UDP-N-acetylmuramoyl-L-alanine--D-glutamate ligase [Patescibacteria group bacterium]
MKLEDLRGKKILIVGYGREGQATEVFLREYVPDCTIGIADATRDPDYLKMQDSYDVAIRSPGVPKRLMRIRYTTATNIFFALEPGFTIGITGTKGKSTTASLVHHFLRAGGVDSVLAGNIGKPVLEAWMEHRNKRVQYVLELSSYMLDDFEHAPDAALTVSLYQDHIDYHGSCEAYYEAKHNLVRFMKRGLYVYNPRFPEFVRWAQEVQCRALPYDDSIEIGMSGNPLLGEHNLENIRGAATLAVHQGIPAETIRNSLKTFRPLPHRLQNIGTYQGITFYDDAISTTPESTIAALRSLKRVDCLFLGGADRGYDFRPLVEEICKRNISILVFFPDTGTRIHAMLKGRGFAFRSILTSGMEEAVRFAYDTCEPGSVVLLSTASPSYSLWKNFEEKGTEYQRLVRAYDQKTKVAPEDAENKNSPG